MDILADKIIYYFPVLDIHLKLLITVISVEDAEEDAALNANAAINVVTNVQNAKITKVNIVVKQKNTEDADTVKDAQPNVVDIISMEVIFRTHQVTLLPVPQ